jgi:hypothetical protein
MAKGRGLRGLIAYVLLLVGEEWFEARQLACYEELAGTCCVQ